MDGGCMFIAQDVLEDQADGLKKAAPVVAQRAKAGADRSLEFTKARVSTGAKKVQEIKKLNQQIQMIRSEMSKLNEQLEDCLKYKDFLDSLTPTEYFDEQRKIKTQRQEDRRR